MTEESLAGQRLEGTPYKLHQLLGAGAHGEVYLGEHVALGKRVVIKLIRMALISRADIVVRFRREARVLVGIEHPAIIEPTDLGETNDGRTFFVMGYVEGTSLREVLRQRVRLPIREACLLMAETADGLHAAHQQGVIHRDIKPENLLLTAKGKMKVLDFGIAKAMQEAGATGTQTANGFVLGTPRYMPPEQAKGETLSGATDLYGLTCVLFELIAGVPFAEGDSPQLLIKQHAFDPAPTLHQRTGRTHPPELEAFIAKGVQKDPRHRFTSGAEYAEALRQLVTTLDNANAQPPAQPSPKIIRGSQPVVASDATEIDQAYLKPTVKMDSPMVPANALPTGKFGAAAFGEGHDTRAIRSDALVVGTATTDQQRRIYEGPETTAPTELLRAVSASTTGESSTEDSYQVTAPVARKRSSGVPLAIVVPVGVLAVGAIVGAVLIFSRGDGEGAARKKESPSANTAETAEPKEKTEKPAESAPPPTPVESSQTAPAPTVTGPATAKPKIDPTATKPTTTVTGTAAAALTAPPTTSTKPTATASAPTAKPTASGKPKMGGGTEDRE